MTASRGATDLGQGVRREALAALSGVLLALSFPKFGHGGVAFFALAPLLLGIRGAHPGRALRLGWLAGALWSLGTLYWTALVVVEYGGLSLPLAIAVMAALCVAVALFPALFAWMVARWVSALGPPGLLAAPVAWVATEVLRTYTFLRFPWLLRRGKGPTTGRRARPGSRASATSTPRPPARPAASISPRGKERRWCSDTAAHPRSWH